jgi:chromosome segregation ATPase
MKTQKDEFLTAINKSIQLLTPNTQKEIKEKNAFYKEAVESTKELKDALIEVQKNGKANKIELARIRVEIHELGGKLAEQQKFYDHWKKRSQDYAANFAQVTQEANDNLDNLIQSARTYQKQYPVLAGDLGQWQKEKNKEDQAVKNQFYLLLKKHLFDIGKLQIKAA